MKHISTLFITILAITTMGSKAFGGCHAQFESVSDPLDDSYGMFSRYIYMTSDIVRQYNLSARDVMRLQYYTSKAIDFSHEITDGSHEVSHGKLIIRNGKTVNEVNVEAKTPGIAVHSEGVDSGSRDMSLDVSFEEGSSLNFSNLTENSDANSRFCLSGHAWQKDSCDAQIPFAGENWWTDDDSGDACLLIDKSALQKFQKTTHTLPGRTLPSDN